MNEHFDIIDRVCRKLAPHYTFGNYTAEDVYQECYIICMHALPKFNSKEGLLEHFLTYNAHRKLRNLKRDRFVAYATPKNKNADKINLRATKKLAIINPGSLADYQCAKNSYVGGYTSYQELVDEVRKSIPAELQEAYDKMLVGQYVAEEIKQQIYELVKESV